MKQSNKNYYNTIAREYDSILEGIPNNKAIRAIVEKKFVKVVEPNKRVLDFGGGTGLDLPWLFKYSYRILFCEPSEEMRKLAIQRAQNYEKITFLEHPLTNFKNWKVDFLNTQKADAVLLNFAVLNAIENIHELFEKLHAITATNSDLFLLVLYRFPTEKKSLIKRSLLQLKFHFLHFKKNHQTTYKEQKQFVYIHSLKCIKKQVNPYFNIVDITTIKNSYFMLLHLKKNDVSN